MAQTADYKLGEFTYGRGWYMIAQSGELGEKPLSLRYFGRDLVLYRGESGTPHLVNAYCPHMGAHIGKNTTSYIVLDGEQVQGESIRCPFHGWRFGPDGECDDIAYCDHRPLPKVSLGTYPLIERAGAMSRFSTCPPSSPMTTRTGPGGRSTISASWSSTRLKSSTI